MGSLFFAMITHFKKPKIYGTLYGRVYKCNHAVYDICTLYEIGEKGLAVIQQRHNDAKQTWWSEIDPWLMDDIYTNENFKAYFDENAAKPIDGIYPTVTIRQIMHALKMKPLKKEVWETVFDGKIKNRVIF